MADLPEALPKVRADPRRTGQVLINLISNASKNGPDGSEVGLRAVQQGEWVRLSVADSGPGVPPEERATLFRRFGQPGPANSRSQAGVGLGLSVVKAIAEGHGGEVGMEDRPGGGAVFWFTLPVARGKT